MGREAEVTFLGFRSSSRRRFLIWLFNPSKLGVAACLVQKFTGVVVYVDPRVRLCIAFCQVSCFVEGFAVFPERSAWPCESIDGIQSYHAILTLRCLYLHYSAQPGSFSTTSMLIPKQA